MKHDLRITLFLVLIFIVAQLAGLWLINYDARVVKNEDGTTTISHEDTAVGPRPQTEGYGTIAFLLIGVLVGTLLVLAVIKFEKPWIWKAWFFLAVAIAITISLGVFLNAIIAIILAVGIAAWKLFKPNILVHNISEVLIYAGIALLIVPMFKIAPTNSFFLHPVFLATVLLIIISIYDAYAVWHSKHMVKMAKFQSSAKVFAGLMIPYKTKRPSTTANSTISTKTAKPAKTAKIPQPSDTKTAILGGGDIAFPLIFSGVVMENLIVNGYTKLLAFQYTLIVTLFVTIALFFLLWLSKKDTFYPAMPFITAGCLMGFAILSIII
jgi:presenilin-like A22 family membrane protease